MRFFSLALISLYYLRPYLGFHVWTVRTLISVRSWKSFAQGTFDISTAAGRLVFHFFAVLTQFEKELSESARW